jgi:type IV secretory pathway TraG/TraD family ATPase VirD4
LRGFEWASSSSVSIVASTCSFFTRSPMSAIHFAWTAWRLGFQPQLGHPWFHLWPGMPVYLPPAFFWWWYLYDATQCYFRHCC